MPVARAITADGRIVGFFGEASGRQHGFLLVDGSFTMIDVPVPGARSTNAFGINARGDIVGRVGVDSAGVQHGFHLPAYGSFTVIDGPGQQSAHSPRGSTQRGTSLVTMTRRTSAMGFC